MKNRTTRQGVLFSGLSKKAVVVRFDQEHSSSDGGSVLLKACDRRLQLSGRLADCLRDRRQQSKVAHQVCELLQQRVFGIACGYADGNDAARLKDDPVLKLLIGRDPLEGMALASQPTLSRFENSVGRAELLRMSQSLADAVIERHKKRKRKARLITIDLDPTHDPTHGAQQLTFFNGFYDSWCYLPVAGFMSFDEEAEQYLFCYVLRPGDAVANRGCVPILKRVVRRLRRAFPRARIRVRLDSGFAGPQLYEFFDAERLEYVVGMGNNDVLKRFAEPLMQQVREDFEQRGEQTERFGECRYRARSWSRDHRVIIKANLAHNPGRNPKDNPRFVVTNLRGSPRRIYEEIYCARGDAENRIKELKYALQIDRTSCTRFWANQLRVLLTAAAYVLMQELRLRARMTGCARAQVDILRLRLLKVAAWIEASVRRVVLHLPSSAPYAQDWQRIARSLGAVPT